MNKESAAKLIAENPNYFSDMAKKRKNIPGGSFRDKDFAKKMAKKRWDKQNENKNRPS